FFQAAEKSKKSQTRSISGGEKTSIAVKTAVNEVMLSSEFCNARRRIAHLLGMYGFVMFLIATIILIFSYPTSATPAPALVTGLWHIGALMVAVGGYWFWFFIRVDVAAEGNVWYKIMRADLFILALLATTTFALVWSYLQMNAGGLWTQIILALFIISSTTLFGTVLWSKFAHMFFKPAAAFQKRVQEADGSRANLPAPADKPAQFGLGIKREPARHY
ncbi:MAG: adenylyl-sulfate reductase, partial [Pseudomonadota bacterium]